MLFPDSRGCFLAVNIQFIIMSFEFTRVGWVPGGVFNSKAKLANFVVFRVEDFQPKIISYTNIQDDLQGYHLDYPQFWR